MAPTCIFNNSVWYHRCLPPILPQRFFLFFITLLLLLINKSHTKLQQPNRSQNTQSRRQWLEPSLDRTWNTASRKNHTGKKCELDTVALSVVDAVGAEKVEGSDGAACCDGWDGAGADVACDTAACCEGAEDEGNCAGYIC